MIYVLYLVHIFTCLFLILVVLFQQGKGADLSVFGGGATQSAFGARSAATLLHKLTVGFFVLFIMTTLSIGIMQRDGGSSSLMSDVETADDAAADAEASPELLPATEEATPSEGEPADPAPDEGSGAAAEEGSGGAAEEGSEEPQN